MERAEIEREVRRLSPWYFRFDLGGVTTDITAPIAATGHRDVAFPDVRDGFWRGKRVLDIACNEGAFSFAALARGAAHVDAFDVRDSNIEKARFAQRILGHVGVDFHVSSIEDWLAAHPEPYDHVLCCGILYHLVDPQATIARVAASARESILVTCVLYGGDDIGYTSYAELDNAAASADSLDSLAPNNTATLIEEFARHGFHPIHVSETRGGDLWGGCNLLFLKAGTVAPHASPFPRPLDVHLAPYPTSTAEASAKVTMNVTMYNWTTAPVAVEGRLVATDATGRTLCEIGPNAFDLAARVDRKGDLLSKSIDLQLDLDLAGGAAPITIAAEVRERTSGALLAARTLVRG